jgi:hypothetical protein
VAIAVDRPWMPPPRAGDGSREPHWSEAPLALRCQGIELARRTDVRHASALQAAGLATDHGSGGRDALWRGLDRARRVLEIFENGATALRSVAMPACGAGAKVVASEEGVVCGGPSRGGEHHLSWYAAATGSTGTWTVSVPDDDSEDRRHTWDASLSRDGLAVWTSCCGDLDVAGGPFGPAPATRVRGVRGDSARWSSDGLIVSGRRRPDGSFAELLEVRAYDVAGKETWAFSTPAGTESPQPDEPWFRVRVTSLADQVALQADVGRGGGWSDVAALSGGTLGSPLPIPSALSPWPPCSAAQRHQEPAFDVYLGLPPRNVEVRLGDARRLFKVSSRVVYGLQQPCLAAERMTHPEAGSLTGVLAPDGRSGFVTLAVDGGERRFRIVCEPAG